MLGDGLRWVLLVACSWLAIWFFQPNDESPSVPPQAKGNAVGQGPVESVYFRPKHVPQVLTSTVIRYGGAKVRWTAKLESYEPVTPPLSGTPWSDFYFPDRPSGQFLRISAACIAHPDEARLEELRETDIGVVYLLMPRFQQHNLLATFVPEQYTATRRNPALLLVGDWRNGELELAAYELPRAIPQHVPHSSAVPSQALLHLPVASWPTPMAPLFRNRIRLRDDANPVTMTAMWQSEHLEISLVSDGQGGFGSWIASSRLLRTPSGELQPADDATAAMIVPQR